MNGAALIEYHTIHGPDVLSTHVHLASVYHIGRLVDDRSLLFEGKGKPQALKHLFSTYFDGEKNPSGIL